MQQYDFDRGRFCLAEAWTVGEIKAAVHELIEAHAGRLPDSRDARIVIKPNLNNDLVALTGNCVDLRVLRAIIADLRDRGYHDFTIADGSNVGVERREIDTFKRLRVDRLAKREGVRIVDLNHDDGHQVVLAAGAHPRVARTVLDCDFLISVPKVKTHVEAGLSCAMKNWVGIARGQEKRHMHYDLGRNIFAINEVVMPDLIIVDGLVGMEGNGPGDGEPFRLGRLMACDNAFLNDAIVAHLVGMPIARVPYLLHARDAGHIDDALLADIQERLPRICEIKLPPPRTRLAELADSRRIFWLKKLARPLTDRPEVLEAAYKLKIIQDVYSREDDAVRTISRQPDLCGECRKCVDFCPTELALDDIGIKTDPEHCIGCLYCWWVCPEDAIELHGPLNAMQRQVDRYKKVIEAL
ncbi:MAG: DUF362 domain-containing protein [Deltaproteobacteria bacterium]|nr:MAG: DUF362 domain-containing protein [Deltaproteobacteria bacterium]